MIQTGTALILNRFRKYVHYKIHLRLGLGHIKANTNISSFWWGKKIGKNFGSGHIKPTCWNLNVTD